MRNKKRIQCVRSAMGRIVERGARKLEDKLNRGLAVDRNEAAMTLDQVETEFAMARLRVRAEADLVALGKRRGVEWTLDPERVAAFLTELREIDALVERGFASVDERRRYLGLPAGTHDRDIPVIAWSPTATSARIRAAADSFGWDNGFLPVGESGSQTREEERDER
jgi:hypothetical protein